MVDSSVWIDFFTGHETPQVACLEACLRDGTELCLCGLVLTEVLQGIRDDREYRRVRSRLDRLPCLPLRRAVFLRAAELYRQLRAAGVTIRNPVDCVIGATALTYGVALLASDRDFVLMAQHVALKTLP